MQQATRPSPSPQAAVLSHLPCLLEASAALPKILILLGLAALVVADRRYGDSDSFESSEAKYNFNWAVDDDSSENHYGQQEARDGDNTQGSYYVALPDGRRQKVTYYVDGDDGYIADVTYSGEARYDSGSRRSYRPPQRRRYD